MVSEKTISESLPLIPLFLRYSFLYKPSSPLLLFSSLTSHFRNHSKLERDNTDETKFLQSRCRRSNLNNLIPQINISPSAAATRSKKFHPFIVCFLSSRNHILTSKMARSISNVKIVSAFVSRELSNAIFR